MNMPMCVTHNMATEFLLYHYQKNFSRKSEATCRTAIDMILLEVLIVLVSLYVLPPLVSLTNFES
jgi:hypothetical protein